MSPEENTATVRRHLGELAALSDKTEHTERKILAQAEKLLSETESKLSELRPHAMVPGASAAREYQDLVQERGRLLRVIEQARKNLGQPA